MSLDIDRHAHVASAIQRWDPRFKIAALMLLILSIALVHSLALVSIGLVVAVGLMLLSRIPLSFVMQGLKLIVVFLLPFFIILPLTYPADTSVHFLGMPFALEGLRLALLIVLKALAIVLVAFVIFGSSRFDINLIALQHLKCPAVIVQIMLFTYRFIFLFLAEMKRMDLAMKARGFVKKADLYTIKVMGGFVGTLLIRSFERTERIYKAMLSKGYQGEFHTLVEFNAAAKDFFKAAIIVVIAVSLFSMDMMELFIPAEQGWI